VVLTVAVFLCVPRTSSRRTSFFLTGVEFFCPSSLFFGYSLSQRFAGHRISFLSLSLLFRNWLCQLGVGLSSALPRFLFQTPFLLPEFFPWERSVCLLRLLLFWRADDVACRFLFALVLPMCRSSPSSPPLRPNRPFTRAGIFRSSAGMRLAGSLSRRKAGLVRMCRCFPLFPGRCKS